ncbi:Rho termination factor N-terminal domain-containing protein, partial [Paenisporosarcina sp.]|uniref:Rho termination factor N-terminal domain-containing protein n=1 Tax=Paenisporosarcina sp. TaxID=1932001 RepID=UPI003C75EF40
MSTLKIAELESMTLKELYALAREFKISYYSKLTKKELIFAILKTRAEQEGYFFMEGVLEIIQSEGFGFLRPINYSPSSEDIYISASQIRRFDLRNGDKVTGKVRPPKENERYYGLLHVELVNGEDPDSAKERVHFPALTPLYPDRHIKLETESSKLSTRIMDLVAPVGFGQRGLIVAPPKAGKTMLLKEIANSIT